MLFKSLLYIQGKIFFSITTGKYSIICEMLSQCTINHLLIELKISVLPLGLLPPTSYWVNLLFIEQLLHCAIFLQS